MADYSQIIEQINAKIVPENNARLITGRKLNDVLRAMIAAVNSTKNDNIEGVEYLALASGINAELVQKFNAYQNSIEYNAGRITAEVNRATNAESALGSRINGVASGIQEEAQRALGAEEALGGRITNEVGAEKARAELAESLLSGRIDTIIASSDLKDIVGTYADLMAYDKTTLGDNDIIEVLTDETHQNTTSFYRYIASSDSFTFVGSYAATYTKTEIDDLLSNLESLVETKMKQVPLTRDTEGIKDKAGNVLNYEAVKALVEDETNFVYLVDARVLHIPAFINEPEDEGAIEFAASFIFGDRAAIHRVIINSANDVKVNQVNVEHESDKLATGTLVHRYETNADKYPSAKALAEYLATYYQVKGNYATSGDLGALSVEVAGKQEKLIPGTGITIAEDGKTISATGGGGSDEWDEEYDVTLESEAGLSFYPSKPVKKMYVHIKRPDGSAASQARFSIVNGSTAISYTCPSFAAHIQIMITCTAGVVESIARTYSSAQSMYAMAGQYWAGDWGKKDITRIGSIAYFTEGTEITIKAKY